jgi:hypothetical protein
MGTVEKESEKEEINMSTGKLVIKDYSVIDRYSQNRVLKHCIENIPKIVDSRGYSYESAEGNNIEIGQCERHGEQWFFVQYNQGGHDATTICVVCMKEIANLVIPFNRDIGKIGEQGIQL